MRWRSLAMILLLALCGCSGETDKSDVVIKIDIDPLGEERRVVHALAQQYTKETGVKISIIEGPSDTAERLVRYRMFLGARSDAVDVFQVDIVWTGVLADHFVDLAPAFGQELRQFFPTILRNNTVDKRLVAIPWFADAGVLYYRKDLFKAYGFDAPPETWDEMETIARTIQDGERERGRADFWGYVWQGAERESLTCNALEWQVAEGGGTIVEQDGSISIDNVNAAKALDRAARWIGTISPPETLTAGEMDSLNMFQSGRAAMMRNWTSMALALEMSKSSVKGDVGVALLPAGKAGRASTLGGWQLAVSRYSKHEAEAVAFVRWLASKDVQVTRATEGGYLPTRSDAYEDPLMRVKMPAVDTLKTAFVNSTARPSSVSRDVYSEISANYMRSVSSVLKKKLSGAEAVAQIAKTVKESFNELMRSDPGELPEKEPSAP